jgi:hypothetical protein
MPNHLHALIVFTKSETTINTIVGNGKCFMAYELVKRLKEKGSEELLNKLSEAQQKKTGVGANRKVLMLDGKNWFDEKVTAFKPNEALTYQLTDCSFPIKGLKHSYSLEEIGNQTRVKQIMDTQ